MDITPSLQPSLWHRIQALMSPPTEMTLPKHVSQRIRIARPLCIFFMVYVHVNPAVAQFDIATHGVRMADWFRFFLADGIGRTSIGLLAIASGYLAISTGRVFPFGKFVQKRVKSLLMPMVVWSAIILAMYLVIDYKQPGYLENMVGESFAWHHLPNWLFGITDHPANFPLGFIRDLFLCAVLTPVFVLLMRTFAIPALAIMFFFMVTHLPTPFLGNNIPMFYSLGILLALKHQPLTQFMDRHAGKVGAAFILYASCMTAFSFYLFQNPASGLEPVFFGFMEVERLMGAAAFWGLCGWVAKQSWHRKITIMEPFSFFVFASHMIITTAFWYPYKTLIGDYYHPTYPLFFLLMPPVTFLIVAYGSVFLGKILPPVATILNGGRPLPEKYPDLLETRYEVRS